ncbi:MAG: putative CRISPR-associated protein [Desulfamplus sp.]|nr:putative CRISPR-associated protein [Desulfamplus sp.]
MRDILVSTVGTSLIGNIGRDGDAVLKNPLASRNAKDLALALCGIDHAHRICGAEINSVAGIISQNLLDQRHMHIILTSDTEDGRFVGQVLSQYYSSRHNGQSRFSHAKVESVTGLTPEDTSRFKHEGLKNLVRNIASAVRDYGAGRIMINATGGYKAQISFAGMIGQALEIPVAYMFEGFNEVITLPPQPVSFDFGFWLTHYDIFCELEAVMEKKRPWPLPDQRFEVLVTSISEGDVHLYELTPAGLLFHETFRSRFASRARELLPPDSATPLEKRKITYEDENRGKHRGLAAFLQRVIQAPFVNSIYTYYYHPAMEKSRPFGRDRENSIDCIDGTYAHHGATTKFTLRTTAGTSQERDAALVWLNEKTA